MAHEKLSINIEASCDNVFAVLHDYTKRLEWDPLLSDARILDGATQAAKGVRTICIGKWKQLWISMITEYISFDTGKLAAVQAVNKPLFFDRFAASIRHIPLAEERSRVEYVYSFGIRPKSLSFFLEPIVNILLQNETQKRLQALKVFMESEHRTNRF